MGIVHGVRHKLRRPIHLTGSDLSFMAHNLGALPGLHRGKKYSSAPIKQVILQFMIELPEEHAADDLAKLVLDGDFKKPRSVFSVHGQIGVDDEGQVTTDATRDQTGFRYDRADERRLVLAATDRFVFGWRLGYTTWEDFISEAEAAWLAYKSVMDPDAVTEVGLRYTNHIPTPTDRVFEIKDYLRASIDVPSWLPQAVSNLFFQVDIPFDSSTEVTLTSSTLTEDDDPDAGLLLDIDVKSKLGVSRTADPSFDGSLRATLDRMRDVKNFVFEASITDATRGLIQ